MATDETRIDAMLAALQAQRDSALNQIVHLQAELAVISKELAALKEAKRAGSEECKP